MPHYQIHKTQKLAVSIDEIWEFISNPSNLKRITPPEMGFDITSGNGAAAMYAGMIITYKVSPLFGIKMNWVTEISQVEEKKFFIDEQRIGPYKFWHHQHKISKIENGVLMEDMITYQPPFGILGGILNAVMIKKSLNKIFDFRGQVLKEIYGELS